MMKYCWYETKHKFLRIFELLVYLIVFYVLTRGVKEDAKIIHIVPLTVMAVAGFCIAFYMVLHWFVEQRKYRVTERGIWVQYPFGIRMVYVWSDFRDITLCKVRYVPKYRSYSVAIRCATETEYPGPRSAFLANESWTTDFYDTMHWRSLVTIEYTPERYEEFAALCPQTIHDYRHLEYPG